MPVYSSAGAKDSGSAGDGGGSFLDALKGFVDIINPLQHLPVIGTLYRKITGDEISPAARLAGDTLFGGPIGAALAMADIAVESSTGKDVGQNMLAMLSPSDDKTKTDQDKPQAAAQTMLADASGTKDFLRSPTPTGTAMDGNIQPALHSYTSTVPVEQKDGNSVMAAPTPARKGGNLKRSFPSLTGSTAVLTSQDAPAGTGRRPGSPELIASEMQAGLSKYRQARVHTPPSFSSVG